MPHDSPIIDWRNDGVRITLPPINLVRCPGFWFSLVFSGLALTFCVVGCIILITAVDLAALWFAGLYTTLSIFFVLIGLWMLADVLQHARRPVILTVDSQQLSIQGDLLFGREKCFERTDIQAVVADDWGLWILDDKRATPRLRYHTSAQLPEVAALLRQALDVPGEWPREPGEIAVSVCMVENGKRALPRAAILSVDLPLLKVRFPGRGVGLRFHGCVERPPRFRSFLQGCVPGDAYLAGTPFIGPEHCEWVEKPEGGRCLRIAPRGVEDDHVLLWADPIAELESTMSNFWDRLRPEAHIKV